MTSRREFLQAVAAGFAGAPLACTADPDREAKRDKLGVALVGLGGLSTNQIAPALQRTEHCRLAGAVTSSAAKAKAWSAKYGIAEHQLYGYDDFDKIADDPDIDVVYIVLPNSMHKEFTLHAAKAKKHVMCEKPMANSVADCEAMIAACEAAGTKLAIGYRCQFEPHHVECMRLARDEVLGAVRTIETGFGFRLRGPGQWRLSKALAGGGALMDVGIYALQAARYLTGEEPTRVAAFESKTDPVLFKEVDETICWTMEFPSGVLATCTTTYAFSGYNRFWVGAENGWFALDDAFGYSGQRGRRSDGEPIRFAPTDHFAVELDEFAKCIREDRPSPVSGEEGLRDLRVIEAIYTSIQKGTVIST